MADIFSKLRGLSRAADYEKSIPEIEAEVSTSQANIERLVASRGPAFFDLSEVEQRKLDDEIREAGLRTRNLEWALVEAKKRRDKAAETERMANLEAAAKEAAAYPVALFELNGKALKLLAEVEAIKCNYDEIKRKQTDFGQLIAKTGRVDLKPTPHPAYLAFLQAMPLSVLPIECGAVEKALKTARDFTGLCAKLGFEV